ncbi:hypothetical protein MLD38_040192 [Melastoma candidum]|uniref:Uncharacterized protein n=1 Tax=Melastoma candidum TaxID=119954 RepID=A0ACB9L5P1_9MYRT|nr:hypothetical protein MLD38_040192 [Melastoma candidum]
MFVFPFQPSITVAIISLFSCLCSSFPPQPTRPQDSPRRRKAANLVVKMASRLDLDGNPIKPLTICMIGAGGFIGSHLCEKLMNETPHRVLGLDVYSDKIKHLLQPGDGTDLPWGDRIQFHKLNIQARFPPRGSHQDVGSGDKSCGDLYSSRLQRAASRHELQQFHRCDSCGEVLFGKWEKTYPFLDMGVYGKTIGSFLPKDHPLRQEDVSPCIFGSIEKQRWSYACAKQLIERLIYAEGAENGLEFTIVRPYNWIGSWRTLYQASMAPAREFQGFWHASAMLCFSGNNSSLSTAVNLREPSFISRMLTPYDCGKIQLGQMAIFSMLVIRTTKLQSGQLAEMMTAVYSKVSEEPPLDVPTVDVSSKEFYGVGYDDSDKRIPNMTIINNQLGWNPKTSLWDLLESTLTYQHRTYSEAIKNTMSEAVAS